MSPALYPVLDRVLAQQDLTSEVKAFVDSMESKYPVELTIFFRKGSDYAPATLKIDGIRLPKDKRGQGIGSKVMQALVDFADDHNLLCVLTPSKDFGASSVERLRRFYGQFGFNRNLGKHKDFRFSEAMIRQPKGGVKSSYPMLSKVLSGKNGDAEAEGYMIDISSGPESEYGNPTYKVVAKDPQGKEVGELTFEVHHKDDGEPIGLETFQITVAPKHRRKGVATLMYLKAEEYTGEKFIRSKEQSPEGRLFWDQPDRPFGD